MSGSIRKSALPWPALRERIDMLGVCDPGRLMEASPSTKSSAPTMKLTRNRMAFASSSRPQVVSKIDDSRGTSYSAFADAKSTVVEHTLLSRMPRDTMTRH
jgi:hypothetical protein